MNYLLTLIFAFIGSISHATTQNFPTVLIKDYQADQNDYEIYLGLSKNYISFVDSYIQKSYSSPNGKKLVELFEIGTRYYLSGIKNMAIKVYSEIFDMAYNEDWSDIQRDLLALAISRLIELDPKNERNYKIYRFYDTKIIPDKKNYVLWNLSRLNFDAILINGKKVDLRTTDTLFLPHGKYRVTFLSNSFKPQTIISDSSQLNLFDPPRIPFIDGTCENPELKIMTDLAENYHLYFSEACILKYYDNRWVSISGTVNETPKFTLDTTEKNVAPEIYNKTWFKITAGLLIGGILIYAAQKNSKSSTSAPPPPTVINF